MYMQKKIDSNKNIMQRCIPDTLVGSGKKICLYFKDSYAD